MNLAGEQYIARVPAAADASFFCTVCQQTCPFSEKSQHLAGLGRQTTTTRSELELHTGAGQVTGYTTLNQGSHTWTRGGFNATDPRSLPALNQPPPQLTRYMWVPTNPGGGPARPTIGPLPVRPAYCYICPKALDSEELSSHLKWHSTNPISNNGPPPRLPPRLPLLQPAVTRKHIWKGKPKKGPKAKKSKKGSLYCNVCKKYKKTKGMASHNDSQKHQKNLAALGLTQASNTTAGTVNTTANATIGGTKLPPGALRGLPLELLAANQPFVKITGDKFHCSLCSRDCFVAGMSSHFRCHTHKRSFAATSRAPLSNAASTEAARTPSQVPDMAPPVPESLTQEGYTYCDVCRTNTSVAELAAHMASQQHHENSTATAV